jgi:carboxylesterase
MDPTPSFPVLAGAEPMSTTGSNGNGVLVLHGFTGNPSSMRPIADAFAAVGWSVEMPRLSGHGTDMSDMLNTTWDDWCADVERAYANLAARSNNMVVCGLSMGGTLAAWITAEQPSVAGLITINGALEPLPPEFADALRAALDAGTDVFPGIGSDIAKEGVAESAYSGTPVGPLLSLVEAGPAVAERVSSIMCPCLVMRSPQDHVVSPTAADYFAARVGGPVERLELERSYHVATLDHDAPLIVEHALEFATRVVS